MSSLEEQLLESYGKRYNSVTGQVEPLPRVHKEDPTSPFPGEDVEEWRERVIDLMVPRR